MRPVADFPAIEFRLCGPALSSTFFARARHLPISIFRGTGRHLPTRSCRRLLARFIYLWLRVFAANIILDFSSPLNRRFINAETRIESVGIIQEKYGFFKGSGLWHCNNAGSRVAKVHFHLRRWNGAAFN